MAYAKKVTKSKPKSPFKVCKNCPHPAKCKKAKRCMGKSK